jgi:hypothetical protein
MLAERDGEGAKPLEVYGTLIGVQKQNVSTMQDPRTIFA